MNAHTPLPATSRCWAWHGSADPLALVLESRPLPAPAAGRVLVRNAAIGLNPVDWKVLGGDLVGWQRGHVPGVDAAGVVVALGDGVGADWLGRRVAYHTSLHRDGSFAEHCEVGAHALLQMPDALDFERAASLPCPALTAWLALEKLPLHAGARLLLGGAGGAVGHYLLQQAVARGCQVTTLSHPRHWPQLRALGAADCRPGPLADGDAWPASAGVFEAAVDAVDPAHAARLVPALRANGHLVCIQGRLPHWPNPPFGRALSLHEVALGALHLHGDARDWARLRERGEQLLAALADATLQAEPLRLAPFAQLPQALEALRLRSFSGKPVLQLDPC